MPPSLEGKIYEGGSLVRFAFSLHYDTHAIHSYYRDNMSMSAQIILIHSVVTLTLRESRILNLQGTLVGYDRPFVVIGATITVRM